MSAEGENKHLFSNLDQANDYIESVRYHYRRGDGSYQGQRTEEQQLIAEVVSDEARMIVDGIAAGILAVGGAKLPENHDTDVELGGFTWNEFKGEFERLLVGIGVITNRLERDGYGVKSLANMGKEDFMKVASVVFSDFLRHNALRLGNETVGIHSSQRKRVQTDDGGIKEILIIRDKDKPESNNQLIGNIKKRGYATNPAAHPAAKISPEKYRELRKQYPEMDKDEFDRSISFYRDVEGNFAERE